MLALILLLFATESILRYYVDMHLHSCQIPCAPKSPRLFVKKTQMIYFLHKSCNGSLLVVEAIKVPGHVVVRATGCQHWKLVWKPLSCHSAQQAIESETLSKDIP